MQKLYLKNIKYLKGEKFMKKLPELYKNLNSKPKDNNKKVYYMENDIRSAEIIQISCK